MTINNIRETLSSFALKNNHINIDKGCVAIVIKPNKPEYMVIHHESVSTTIFPKSKRLTENQQSFVDVCGREGLDPRFYILLKKNTPITEIVLAMSGYTQITARKKAVKEEKEDTGPGRFDGLDWGVVQMTDRFTGMSLFFTSSGPEDAAVRANNLTNRKKSFLRHIDSPKAAKWLKERMTHCGNDTFDYEHLGKGYDYVQARAVTRDMNDLQGQVNEDLILAKLAKLAAAE